MNTAGVIDIPLGTRGARTLFLAAVLVVVGGYIFATVRIACSAEIEESLDPKRIAWASGFDNGNPRLHNRMGLYYLDGGELQVEGAVKEFRMAVALNPQVAEYWRNLGRSCLIAGDTACADDAYRRALGISNFDVQTLNDAGVYFIATGRSEIAWPIFHRLLEISPTDSTTVLALCLGTAGAEATWRGVVRDLSSEAVGFEFFRLLAEQGNSQASGELWPHFVASRSALSLEAAGTYLDALEAHRDYAGLVRVWRDLERAHAAGMPPNSGNLVVNAHFFQFPTNLGLDWHLRPERFLETSVVAVEGEQALLLDFMVPNNAEHEPVYQLISVEPNREYQLRAQVRVEAIRSDSGPRLRVSDPECRECLDSAAEGSTGTTDWHELVFDFRTGPATQVVRLSVWRPRGRAFPMEISGRYWLKEVSLCPIR